MKKKRPAARKKTRRNPVVRKPGRPNDEQMAAITAAFTKFHGTQVQNVTRLSVPQPGPAWLLGQVAYVAYYAERDGYLRLYHHDFKPRSAPYLCIVKDGRIVLGGGAYHVADRGIVDESPRRT